MATCLWYDHSVGLVDGSMIRCMIDKHPTLAIFVCNKWGKLYESILLVILNKTVLLVYLRYAHNL